MMLSNLEYFFCVELVVLWFMVENLFEMFVNGVLYCFDLWCGRSGGVLKWVE